MKLIPVCCVVAHLCECVGVEPLWNFCRRVFDVIDKHRRELVLLVVHVERRRDVFEYQLTTQLPSFQVDVDNLHHVPRATGTIFEVGPAWVHLLESGHMSVGA